MTPIHLACEWPEGLSELLSGSGLPPIDPGYDSPLAFSTKYSAIICTEGKNPVLCSNCSCYKSTETLLRYDCIIGESVGSNLYNLLREASFRTKVTLLKHLKGRRVRLRDFALGSLSRHDCMSIRLDINHIPDTNEYQIVKLLERRGFQVPEALQTVEISAGSPDRSSIYHKINCHATADVLLALGFTEFDSEDSNGRTPLSRAVSLEYATWLIDHGADITAPSSNAVGFSRNQKVVHGVAHSFGRYLGEILFPTEWATDTRQKFHPELSNRFFNLISDVETPDKCVCSCSAQGCTPFLAILKEALRHATQNFDEPERVNIFKIFKFPSRIYKVLPEKLVEDPKISNAVIRYLTFSTLEVRHTCCYCYCELRGRLFEDEPYDEEELQEFREEDSPLTELLEELMEEFENEYHLLDGNFPDFLEGYWKERMKGVLSDMEQCKATEEQKRQMIQIGVKLDEDAKEPRLIEVEEKEEEETDLSYWIKKMDEIVAE